MAEPDSSEAATRSEKIGDATLAAMDVLANATVRALPVIQTAMGAVVLTAGMCMTAEAVNRFRDLATNPSLSTGLLAAVGATFGTAFQINGVKTMREPVTAALKYFGSRFGKR